MIESEGLLAAMYKACSQILKNFYLQKSKTGFNSLTRTIYIPSISGVF